MESRQVNERGLFITFEGGEGSGKSTQIALLAGALQKAGKEVVVTREPGGTEIGEKIRHLLKFDPASENLVAEAELLLFSASRAQLVREFIQPHLQRGVFVLSDRFFDSTTVYQGIGRGLDPAVIQVINGLVAGDVLPDVTFLLDLDPADGQARIPYRQMQMQLLDIGESDLPDRFDNESMAYHQKVRQGYLGLAAQYPARFCTLNAAQPVETLRQAILNQLYTRHGLSLADSSGVPA
jgi:dTMP kinase